MKLLSATVLVGLTIASAASLAWASQDKPRGGAPEEIAPMEKVVALAQSAQPGRIVEIELEREHGRSFYEVKVVAEDGKVHKLVFDAHTSTRVTTEYDH